MNTGTSSKRKESSDRGMRGPGVPPSLAAGAALAGGQWLVQRQERSLTGALPRATLAMGCLLGQQMKGCASHPWDSVSHGVLGFPEVIAWLGFGGKKHGELFLLEMCAAEVKGC